MPASGAEQVSKHGRGSHARESTSFSGTHPSVIHRGGQAALVLVPEVDEEPLEDEPLEDFDEAEDEEESDEEVLEEDDEDDSAFAGTELVPVDRLSLR